MRGVDFKNEIEDLIRLITAGMGNVFGSVVESFGLTMVQARILMEIERCNLSTVGNLGSTVGLSSGNASTMCKKLEKAGFVKRIRNSEDERYVKLELTELGLETIKKIDAAFQKKYAPVLESKSRGDFDIIIAGMKKLNELLTEMEKSIN
jgi:DNA-binding MarR family transcriptional regulator